jgi:hypothetical protein
MFKRILLETSECLSKEDVSTLLDRVLAGRSPVHRSVCIVDRAGTTGVACGGSSGVALYSPVMSTPTNCDAG